jgi:hypothetical protein
MLQVVPVISDQLPVISYQLSGVSESPSQESPSLRVRSLRVSESGDRRLRVRRLFLFILPTPYTLHPTPYALHPTPHTPH